MAALQAAGGRAELGTVVLDSNLFDAVWTIHGQGVQQPKYAAIAFGITSFPDFFKVKQDAATSNRLRELPYIPLLEVLPGSYLYHWRTYSYPQAGELIDATPVAEITSSWLDGAAARYRRAVEGRA